MPGHYKKSFSVNFKKLNQTGPKGPDSEVASALRELGRRERRNFESQLLKGGETENISKKKDARAKSSKRAILQT